MNEEELQILQQREMLKTWAEVDRQGWKLAQKQQMDWQGMVSRETYRTELQCDRIIKKEAVKRKLKIETETGICEMRGSLVYFEKYGEDVSCRIISAETIVKVGPLYSMRADNHYYRLQISGGDGVREIVIGGETFYDPIKLLQFLKGKMRIDTPNVPQKTLAQALSTYVWGRVDFDWESEIIDVSGWRKGRTGWQYITKESQGYVWDQNRSSVQFPPRTDTTDMQAVQQLLGELSELANAEFAGALLLVQSLAFCGDFFDYPPYERILVIDSKDVVGDIVFDRYLRLLEGESVVNLEETQPGKLKELISRVKDRVIGIRMPVSKYAIERLNHYLEKYLNEEPLGADDMRWKAMPVVISRNAMALGLTVPTIVLNVSRDSFFGENIKKDWKAPEFWRRVSEMISSDGDYWPEMIQRKFADQYKSFSMSSVSETPRLSAALETVIEMMRLLLQKHGIDQVLIDHLLGYLDSGKLILFHKSDENDVETFLVEDFVELIKHQADEEEIEFQDLTGESSGAGNCRFVAYYNREGYYLPQSFVEKQCFPRLGIDTIRAKRLLRYLLQRGLLRCNGVKSNGYKKRLKVPNGEIIRVYEFARQLFDPLFGIQLCERGRGQKRACL